MDESSENAKIGLSVRKLGISVILAVAIWAWLFSSIAFALILVFSIIVHEYGHYYWMGREGITRRGMIMIPPFGAVAYSYEPWPSYGAEARIALAGPIFGLIPVMIFFALFYLTRDPMWAIGVMLAGFINAVNLVPVLPLDGGRCMRALLASLNPYLNNAMFAWSWTAVVITVLFFRPIMVFGVVVGVILFLETRSFYASRKTLHFCEKFLLDYEGLSEEGRRVIDADINRLGGDIEYVRKMASDAKKLVMPPRMNSTSALAAFICYASIIFSHIYAITLAHSYLAGLENLMNYFPW